MRLVILPLLFLLSVTPCATLSAQTARSSLEAKLALENSLEKRVQQVLSEALGTEDIIVIISAELQDQEKKSAEIMPGVPEKGRMGEPSLSSSLTMVKKLSASLILDRTATEADAQLARKLAAGLLGLPADRLDLVSVERMDFRKARPVSVSDLLAPPNLWSMLWLVLVAALAFLTVYAFLSPISRSARAFVEAFSAKAAAPAELDRPERASAREEAAPAAAAQAAQAVQADGRKPPFWFLNAGSLSSLAFILKNRPVEDMTIVLSYAPADLAAKLAEALYPKSAEALAQLPRVTLMPEARIRSLEKELQEAMDYVVGGEEKAIGIINGLDEAVQEKALAAFVRLDPALAKRLNSAVVKLAMVRDLEPAQAQNLARRVPLRVLAAALKGTPHAEPFTLKLTGGMQERFRQELDLTRALNHEAYKAERARVVETLRDMIKEGFITQKGATAPHAAAPHAVPHAAPKPGAPAPAAAKPAAAPAPAPAAAKPAAAPAPAPKP